ncbi:hypothetical protein ACJIZ3_021408 [Penstemon smallii]|uniref:Uncharacterized protein n=1 Tax=Penstemon smallii TaxID=265156 RepID=A0ABD3SLB9_9LAMI
MGRASYVDKANVKKGHRHYRKLRYLFDHKQCAIFPRQLFGSPLYPIDLSANDEDALVVSPVRVMDANHESEAAAPPSEEVNPLAIIEYDRGNAGAAGDVNGDMGGHISDVD